MTRHSCTTSVLLIAPDVSAGAERLHEGLGPRLGDGTEVVHQVGLGHADSRVLDGQGVVGLDNGNPKKKDAIEGRTRGCFTCMLAFFRNRQVSKRRP